MSQDSAKTADISKEAYQEALEAVKRNGRALENLPSVLQNDKTIVLAAVQHDGRALEVASKDLKGDRDIVMAAVKQDPLALQFASEDLMKDQEIVLTALWEVKKEEDEFLFDEIFEDIDDSLKADPEFLRILEAGPGAMAGEKKKQEETEKKKEAEKRKAKAAEKNRVLSQKLQQTFKHLAPPRRRSLKRNGKGRGPR